MITKSKLTQTDNKLSLAGSAVIDKQSAFTRYEPPTVATQTPKKYENKHDSFPVSSELEKHE